MNKQPLPEHIKKYFWGDDTSELDLKKNEQYILQTLLERGDQAAVAWVLSKVDKKTIKSFLPRLRLSKKSAGFWNIYFS